MNDTPIWQKPISERAAAFAVAFAGAVPAERTLPSLVQQLASVRAMIIKKREQGFSVDQIRTALKHPAIAIDASPASIRRLLREADRRRDLRRKARAAALMTSVAAAPAKPATVATRAGTTSSRS